MDHKEHYNIELRSRDKLEFISNLGAMLSAGIPLLESVEALIEGSKGDTKKLLEILKKDLESGKTIATSFARFPKTFDPIAINLIKGGEEAGNLEEILKDLTATFQKNIEFIQKIKSAFIYPVFVMGVFVVIMLVILTFVIPRIAAVFGKLHIVLPLPTKILIWTSGILIGYWVWIIVGAIAISIAVYFIYTTQKKFLLSKFSSLPFIYGLTREIDLVNFTRSLALLLSSGIPISKSLELSREVLVRKEIIQIVEIVRKEVIQGKRITDSFRANNKNNIIPQLFIRMIDAGERSGKLEKSFQEASDYFDGRVSISIKTITTLMEPALLLMVAAIVGGIMLSIIAPIYQLIGSIQVR